MRKSTPEETEEPIHQPLPGRLPLDQYLFDGRGNDGCLPSRPRPPAVFPGAVVTTRCQWLVEIPLTGHAVEAASPLAVDHTPPIKRVQPRLQFIYWFQFAPCWVRWSHNPPPSEICDTVDTPWALAPVAAIRIRIWDWGISAQ